jgi:hypothetical protein
LTKSSKGKGKWKEKAIHNLPTIIAGIAAFIALGSLLVSVLTCHRDDQRYNETTKPLAQSQEALNSMQGFDGLINNCRAMLESSDNNSGVIGDLSGAIKKAESLQIEASIAYNLKKYSDVLDCITEGTEGIQAVIGPEAPVDLKSSSNVTVTAIGGTLDFQGWATVSAENGTTATTKEGQPLDMIEFSVHVDMQPVPSNAIRVLEFDVQPSGATFSQPITITFHYLPSNVPYWYLEKDLVIASWNDTSTEWDIVPSVVDTSVHAITTSAVSRLTTFVVLAIPPGS